MATYQELLQQRAALDAQIEEARKTERTAAVNSARQLVQEYGLSEKDVFGSGSRGASKAKGLTIPPKYRDPMTGATWTGRGKPPLWIAGKDREQFLIRG